MFWLEVLKVQGNTSLAVFVERQYFPSQRSLLENLVYGHNDYKLKQSFTLEWTEWKVLQLPKWTSVICLPSADRKENKLSDREDGVSQARTEVWVHTHCKDSGEKNISRMWQKRNLVLWVGAMRKFRNGQATVKQPWRPLGTGPPIPGAAPQLPVTALNHNPLTSPFHLKCLLPNSPQCKSSWKKITPPVMCRATFVFFFLLLFN